MVSKDFEMTYAECIKITFVGGVLDHLFLFIEQATILTKIKQKARKKTYVFKEDKEKKDRKKERLQSCKICFHYLIFPTHPFALASYQFPWQSETNCWPYISVFAKDNNSIQHNCLMFVTHTYKPKVTPTWTVLHWHLNRDSSRPKYWAVIICQSRIACKTVQWISIKLGFC